MSDSIIVTGITLTYLALVLWVGLRARTKNTGSSLEEYVAGGRHVGVVILFFILGAEIFSAFAFLGAPGWAYKHGAPALYILAYLSLVPIIIWIMGPRVRELGKQHGYLTQADMISHHYNSKSLGAFAGIISVVAFIPYLAIQIAGAGMLFQAATGGLVPFWLGSLIAFLVVAVYVYCSGLGGIGWTNLMQGVMMVGIAWFLGWVVTDNLFGGVGPMFEQIQLQMPEYLVMPGSTGVMGWGAFSTAILVSAFGGAMWPHLFMKFYTADSAYSLRKVSVFYPLFAYLLVPLLFVGFAGILTFADAPLAKPDEVLLKLVMEVLDLSPWVTGIMLSGALAAAMSTGANLAHTAATIAVRDILCISVLRNASEQTVVRAIQISVLVVSLLGYLFAIYSPASLVAVLLGAFGLILQLMPMVVGALFIPSLRKSSVVAGAALGGALTLLYQFILPSPFAFHPGFWGIALNLLVVTTLQLLISGKTHTVSPKA
ncbi:SSS family solute:Na+ symporter [Oceanisphaera litoralis]|uniref:sodium:solute symporter family protein n=1 Tax=Oceanisphaera litoralis TaxID=225144 RepID=UPI0019566C58|nr:sodium:solute symporter family protein [Oceanisphaera litoralis]MBM7456620.1 SSS family solute:Na+ symporter [Oceanisphaera litoralis]